MEKIYMCHCGCGAVVWKDGDNELTFESLTVEPEIITGIDEFGFINGKHSLLPDGADIAIFELQFMRNVNGTGIFKDNIK
jgi:hypothetical protein